MNAMCPTFYPGPKLLALLDHTFAEYMFLCLIDAHGKTLLCGSHQVPLDYGQMKHVWYTQWLIVADTTFSVSRSSSYKHHVSNCHSNLVTTPASSIDLTSKSVHSLSLPFLCRIFSILDKLKIEMTNDSLYHAGKTGVHSYGENLCNAAKIGEHSCVENFHGDNLNPHNINKQHLCHPEHCLTFVGPEHQSSKIYHAFSNYVKTTFKNGLSLSEVDLIHLKRETNHGSNLMDVDWGGNIDSNYTSTTKHGPNLMEVDWGGNIDPNYTSSGCMIMQVDWGGKLRVNHIN